MKKCIVLTSLLCGLAFAPVLTGLLFAGSFDAGKLSFTATLNTTDNTTNAIATVAVPSNRVARVEAQFLGIGGSYQSASYGKVATFRNLGGTNTIQISITATIGAAETDSHFDALIRTDGTNAVLSVAGDTDVPMQWVTHVTVYYSAELAPELP